MTVYRKPDGDEIVVCDTCGISTEGDKADVSKLTAVDFTAEMLAAGFPQGTALSVKDTCPDCEAKRKKGMT